MCEYCGCQSIPAIGDLTREHDAVVDLIGQVRSAYRDGDVAGMTAGTRRIAELLGPHTAVEEQGLFPAMAGDYPDQIADLVAEHGRIEAVLVQVTVADGPTPSDPDWSRRLLDALDVLRHHILKEQDGVFPAALAELSTAQWETVDAVRDRVGTALPGVGR
ncbi:MAG TPA: hemerythrin domain-containing protein [Actinocrinis sp.]|nr:hemerythrin domain-containing protein [Actinocrinis sp.]